MKLSTLTTGVIEQQIISSDDDLLYWQDKLDRCKNFQRRNYYRSKIEVAKHINQQAKAELQKRKQLQS